MSEAGLGAMMSGISSGYMAGKSFQRDLEQQRKEDEERDEEVRKRREEEERQRQQTQQQQSQQGLGVDPGTAASVGSSFMGTGSTAGSTGGASLGVGSSAGAGGAGAGAAGGGSAAASGAGGAVAAAGPWAALAAIVAGNEISARNGGHRRDGFQYVKDLAGGKVLEQDTNGRWAQKLGGYDDDKTGLLNDAGAGAEFTTLDFKNGFKKLTTEGTAAKALDAVKKIF